MIDMDDVITDGTFRKQIEDFIGNKIDTSKTGYFLQNALGEQKETFFRKGPLNMYQDAPLKSDAFQVIKKLNSVYDLYIVSSFHIPDAPYQDGNQLKYKVEYLQKELPFLDERQFIFTNAKKMIHFDIKIDDSVANLENAKMKLLFSAYHNLEISEDDLRRQGIKRVHDWLEVEKILLEG